MVQKKAAEETKEAADAKDKKAAVHQAAKVKAAKVLSSSSFSPSSTFLFRQSPPLCPLLSLSDRRA